MSGILKIAGKALLISLLFVASQSFAYKGHDYSDDKHAPSMFSNSSNSPVIRKISDSIYTLISLGDYGLEKDIFFNAYKGFQYLKSKGKLRKTNLLTICDYSQSSNNKRLYVIDVVNSRLLYNTYVSHGKNSGDEYATSFSNYENSNKSSLGFMVTEGTYNGKGGLSLILNGLERGFNDLAASRSIVLHGSHFVNEQIINQRGMIGKSLGCPAVPLGIHKKIIDAIKGGSCFFAYYPDDYYSFTSSILNTSFDLTPQIPIPSSVDIQQSNDLIGIQTITVK